MDKYCCCARGKVAKKHSFSQVLPNDMMGDEPALLSGADSERLGLISINTGEVVMETTWNVGSPAYILILRRKSTDFTELLMGSTVMYLMRK